MAARLRRAGVSLRRHGIRTVVAELLVPQPASGVVVDGSGELDDLEGIEHLHRIQQHVCVRCPSRLADVSRISQSLQCLGGQRLTKQAIETRTVSPFDLLRSDEASLSER